jgi:hypothetical protein
MAGSNALRVPENIQPRVTQQMNKVLASEFIREEVIKKSTRWHWGSQSPVSRWNANSVL